MAIENSKVLLMFDFSVCLLKYVEIVTSDPDILTDLIVPGNRSEDTLDGNFFTFTSMDRIFGSVITSFKATKASKAEFPASDGQSTSLAVLQFPGVGVNPPTLTLVHPSYY
nr:putative germin-like protein 9-2 [Nicotiana tomentosiformis]